jgi:thiamine transporter ThiT
MQVKKQLRHLLIAEVFKAVVCQYLTHQVTRKVVFLNSRVWAKPKCQFYSLLDLFCNVSLKMRVPFAVDFPI